MKDYLETLAQTLLDTYGNMEGRVKLHFPMSELELDVDTAIPLGLIANELITNSLKYAFYYYSNIQNFFFIKKKIKSLTKLTFFKRDRKSVV